MKRLFILLLFCLPLLSAANQKEEALSNSVKAVMQKSISDLAAPKLLFDTPEQGQAWLNEMSQRLARRIKDKTYREDFLKSVHYEATRAGLDPQLVLGLIQVESAFKKYAVSSVGARGYMQVMPFWVKAIGTNDLRALGRYNGSLGKAKYPNLVHKAWKRYWDYTPISVE